MQKYLYLLLVFSFIAMPLRADTNDLFLSLTRTAEKLQDLPTSVAVISQDEIRAKGGRNLSELLENETGISVNRQGTYGELSTLSIRGSTAQQVLVLVDGRRINDIATGDVDLNTVPADKIQKIEVIRGGAASAVYGTGALGGVVNIITKKSDDGAPLFDLRLPYGSFNTQNYQLTFNTRRDNISGTVAAAKGLSDGWRKNSDYDNRDFFARIGYKSSLGTFDFSGSTFRSDLGVPGPAFDPNTFAYLTPDRYNGIWEKDASSPDARQSDAKDYGRIEYTKEWEKESFKAAAYSSREQRQYKDANPLWPTDNNYDSQVFGSELLYTTRFGLTAGSEWWEEKHVRTDVLASARVIDRSRVNTAVFLQEELKLERLSIIPSVRYDANSAYGNVATPRISLIYRANGLLRFSANTGKTWRAPTFNDLYYSDMFSSGDPGLKPEEGISSDIGVEYRKDTFRSCVTFFRTDTRNLIQWLPDGLIYRAQNTGSSVQEGAELEIGRKIFGGLYHSLNYTYLWAEDTENHTPLVYRPRTTVNYTLAYLTTWGMRVNAGAEYVGPQATGSTTPDLNDYTLLGFGISQKIADVELWMKADNLTNVKYQTRLGYPLPGTIFSGGISLRFWE